MEALEIVSSPDSFAPWCVFPSAMLRAARVPGAEGDGVERGSRAVGHHAAQASPRWRPLAAGGLPDDPGGWDVSQALVWLEEASCLLSVVKAAGTGPRCSGDALPDEIWSLGKARMEHIRSG